MTIILPLPLNLANSRMHWRTKLNAKKAYYRVAPVKLYSQVGPDRRASDRTETRPMRVTVTLYVHQPMDRDNLMARCKWPIDVLRAYGLIREDNDTWLQWAGVPEQVVDRKRPRIEIELEQVNVPA